MSRLRKAVVRFPKPQETKPTPHPDDKELESHYLEHLLELADQFYRNDPEKIDPAAADKAEEDEAA